MIPEVYRDTSLPLKENFSWYLYESMKTSLANYYLQIGGLIILIILGMNTSKSELAAYALISAIITLVPYFSLGFMTHQRNKINFNLEKHDYEACTRIFRNNLAVFFLIAIIISIVLYVFMVLGSEGITDTNSVKYWIS